MASSEQFTSSNNSMLPLVIFSLSFSPLPLSSLHSLPRLSLTHSLSLTSPPSTTHTPVSSHPPRRREREGGIGGGLKRGREWLYLVLFLLRFSQFFSPSSLFSFFPSLSSFISCRLHCLPHSPQHLFNRTVTHPL